MGGRIVTIEEVFHLVESSIFYMVDIQTDSWPSIRVYLVNKISEEMLAVAIRSVKVSLTEFLYYYLFLNIQTFLTKSRSEHAIALKPECRLDIISRERYIVICYIIGGKRISITPYTLHMIVEVGDIDGTSKHQMLKKMSETSALGSLIASSDSIEHVERRQRSHGVLAYEDTHAVSQNLAREFYHLFKIEYEAPPTRF